MTQVEYLTNTHTHTHTHFLFLQSFFFVSINASASSPRYFNFYFFVEVQLIYNVSGVQQSDPDIYICNIFFSDSFLL